MYVVFKNYVLYRVKTRRLCCETRICTAVARDVFHISTFVCLPVTYEVTEENHKSPDICQLPTST